MCIEQPVDPGIHVVHVRHSLHDVSSSARFGYLQPTEHYCHTLVGLKLNPVLQQVFVFPWLRVTFNGILRFHMSFKISFENSHQSMYQILRFEVLPQYTHCVTKMILILTKNKLNRCVKIHSHKSIKH